MTRTWRTRLGTAVVGAAAIGAAAAGAADGSQIPPPDQVFIREMPWSCGELGTFTASYNVMGQNPPLMWLSRDGGRTDAVMVLLVDGQLTWTYPDGSTQTFGPSAHAAHVSGLAQYRCDLDFAVGEAMVDGWATVAVVRGTDRSA
jgi:hypothetical protein